MRKLGAVLTMVGGLAMASATPVWANGFSSYRLCGGNTFSTCAAVEISVTGHTVTMRVWNISSNLGATYGQGAGNFAGSVLDGIAFFNLPAGLQVNTGSLTVSGPGATASHGWTLKNYGAAGAFALDARNGPGHTLTGGIGSGCAAQNQMINSPTNLMVNPCSTLNAGNSITFSFQVTGNWNGRSDVSMRSFNGMTGETSEFWTGIAPNGNPGIATTVTPEPVTMTLLATGLAGMGGAGLVRRRKKQNDEI
jgi:hypothetical protein